MLSIAAGSWAGVTVSYAPGAAWATARRDAGVAPASLRPSVITGRFAAAAAALTACGVGSPVPSLIALPSEMTTIAPSATFATASCRSASAIAAGGLAPRPVDGVPAKVVAMWLGLAFGVMYDDALRSNPISPSFS